MTKRKLTRDEVLREIKKNRNHSWFREVYNRHSHEPSTIVMKYLGTDITYGTFFEESYKWAKALKKAGIKKGYEFVVCLDRTPELTYLIGAASLIGAKIKLISEKLEKEFIKKNIIEADSTLFFVQNVKLTKLKDILKNLQELKVIPISWERSLDHNYIHLDKIKANYKVDSQEEEQAKKELKNIYSLEEFLESGQSYEGKIEEEVLLKDPFTITYSSGTTKEGLPKGIVHSIGHYIIMGRYHDSEVSGLPNMRGLSTYSNIPIYSNSWLSSAFTDILIKGGIVILDPIDTPKYFVIALRIHEANMNIATTSTWLLAAKSYYLNQEKYYLKSALFNFAAGEQLSPGEEKLLNKYLSDVKAGTSKTKISLAKISTAGSDCEHGSLFIKIFRAYSNPKFNKKYKESFSKSLKYADGIDPSGMKPYDFVTVKVLREDGTYAIPYEYGRIVCNSPITMLEYDRNEEATKNFLVDDAYGNKYADMNVYGYMDKKGNVIMKGRIPKNKTDIPEFLISDIILQNSKLVMSCEVVSIEENEKNIYIAHIMPHLNKTTQAHYNKIISKINSQLKNKFGNTLNDKLYIRFRNPQTSFPLTNSAKRNTRFLREEGISKAIPLNELLTKK